MENPKSTLAEAMNSVNRHNADYGDPLEMFTNVARGWSIILSTEVSPDQVGLMMIWLKVARHMNCPKCDNLVDIAGYAECLARFPNGFYQLTADTVYANEHSEGSEMLDEQMTDKQKEYIEGLCEQIGWNKQDCFQWLCREYKVSASHFLRWEQVTKTQASKLIAYLKEQK